LDSERNPNYKVAAAALYECEAVMWEMWVGNIKSSQRQYRILWKSGERETTRADQFDLDWPAHAREWERKCNSHGDLFPLPEPVATSTRNKQLAIRKYR
jgi:hypothetical protein